MHSFEASIEHLRHELGQKHGSDTGVKELMQLEDEVRRGPPTGASAVSRELGKRA